MQRFSSPHGCVWVHGLVDLRERIEQAPCCSIPEYRVCRMPPLIEHIGNLRGRDRLAIHRPDHEVMGFEVVHPMAFVGLDSLIEVVETITQLSNRPCREVPEVSHGIACVLATYSDFTREGEVVANKHSGSCNQPSWISLVVAVSDSHYP